MGISVGEATLQIVEVSLLSRYSLKSINLHYIKTCEGCIILNMYIYRLGEHKRLFKHIKKNLNYFKLLTGSVHLH